MNTKKNKVRVAVVQDYPVFFDKEATLKKIENLVSLVAKNHVDLILFPESFLPGYPRGFDFGTVVGSRTAKGRDLYLRYCEASFDLESPELQLLEDLSQRAGAYLVIGVTEKQAHSGSLFCSMLYISPSSGLMGVHRKIKPTGQERVIWAEAGAESLVTFNTPIGILGGLICWENYMPLARQSMYNKGVEIYLAPTADSRDTWTTTMRHIAVEGRCFVLASNQYFEHSMYPKELQLKTTKETEVLSSGGSAIIAPDGKTLAGPLFGRTGILTADIELNEIIRQKLDFDAGGHYSRDDLFRFNIPDQPDTIHDVT